MENKQLEYLLAIYKQLASGQKVDAGSIANERKSAILERDRLTTIGNNTDAVEEYISELDKILYNDNFTNRD